LLGIDWGEKRIGLAFADSIGVALPVDAAVSTSKRKRFMQIENLIKERCINELVVGYPLNMDDPENPTLSTARALKRANEHLGDTDANVSIYIDTNKESEHNHRD
jgi:putative transcription antitermination factor YqgF